MKARLIAALSLFAVLLVTLPAFATRKMVDAKKTAVLRAKPDEGASSAGVVKKGDKVTILQTRGEWTNVQTPAGKKGWVKNEVVSEAKSAEMNLDTTQIAAAEGSTEMAIRGKGQKRRTMVVGTGKIPLAVVNLVADQVRKIPQVTVIDKHTVAKIMPDGSAGGLAGAHQLGDAKKADLVVAISPGTNQELQYQVVDLKKGEVIASGTTTANTQKSAAEEIGKTVEKGLLAPPPATKPMTGGTAGAATTTGAAATPAGTPMANACMQQCMDASRIKAFAKKKIEEDCMKKCAAQNAPAPAAK